MVEEKSAAYIRAEKRVEAKLGFYRHFAVYIGVNLLLFLINVFSSRGEWWFYWPLLGWGIGVFFHFLKVFVTGGLLSERVREGMIRKELRKEEKRPNQG
jgi:hypothetical protein